MRAAVTLPPSAPLPSGYRYGAHVSGAGWQGYWVVRDDGAAVIAQVRPDLFMLAEEPGDDHGLDSTHGLTAEGVAEALRAAFDEEVQP